MFGAFIAMGLTTVVLAGYGLYVLNAAGRIIVETYDGPLMAINFARAASLDFAEMDKDVLRRKMAPVAQRARIDGEIDQLSNTFFDDIAIAQERSVGERQGAIITRIRESVHRWNAFRRAPPAAGQDDEIDAVVGQILGDFDTLIELTADRSFVERRKAVSAITAFRNASFLLSGIAVMVGLTVAVLLTRQMIRPLREAAKVADRIADGQLQTPIPIGGKDETGTLLRSMTVMQDNIREMMQREVEQRQSAQARLFDALESAREGIILVDAGGKIVMTNSQVADFFPKLARVESGADFAAAFARLRSFLVRREDEKDGPGMFLYPASSVGEYQIQDGRWVRFSRSETRDGGFFLSLIDFTEIKQREEHLKEAKAEAEAANTAKSHFLANMSHELRTPLNAIIGFSEIISGELFGPVGNAQYRDYAGSIMQSGRHLLGIINNVLDIAKSEARKLELRPEIFDLGDVLQDCAAMMREVSSRAEVHLDVPPLPAPLPVYGEPAKLKQIVLNLLSNAVKFNNAGGRVTLLAAPGTAGMAEIRVVDTGIGMSPSEVVLALKPFVQVDSSLSRRYDGTGLGLPLSKALVELHGGTMTIDSLPGVGTTVTVTIPQSAGQREALDRAV